MGKSKHKKQHRYSEAPPREDPTRAPFSPVTGKPHFSPPGSGEHSRGISSAVQAGFPYVGTPPPTIRAGHLIYSPPAAMSPRKGNRSPRSGTMSPGSPAFQAGVPEIAEELRHDQMASKNRVITTSVIVFVSVVLILVIVWARLWRDEALANREPPPVTTPFYPRAGTERG
ncbi:uncharacterized protein LOC142817224 [Rhipicephalus microplus]|uniref:uncharacterized protein LOC142817224 n=1 Tax=Rhipicephalus microplus TaxID=6941 RepID=UPI003F6AD70B